VVWEFYLHDQRGVIKVKRRKIRDWDVLDETHAMMRGMR
jgi:hypothetical protein